MAPIPKEISLLIAIGGVFGGFSYMAVKQEILYKTTFGGEGGEKFAFTFLALAAERGINALIALLGVMAFGGSGKKIPHMDIFNSGVSQMFAMAAAGEALRYVSYATQVLGKSCKMVPVMAGGLVLGGKSYKSVEYLQVVLVTLGVVVFNFGGKSKGAGSDSSYGLMLIGASLLMDMVTGGLQDKVKTATQKLNNDEKAKTSMFESMLYTNLSGTLVALGFAFYLGHVTDGIAFLTKYPEALTAMLVYSLSSAVGQVFIYYTVTEFGPLLLTTVTTTRKIFSTLYSVLIVNPEKGLNEMQWAGCGLVFFGIGVEVVEKYLKGSSKPKPAATPTGGEAGGKKKKPAKLQD